MNIRIVTLLIPIIAGCFSTRLPKIPTPSALPRLIEAAEMQMPLRVVANDQATDVGYQYMLFGIPVARVDAPYISESVGAAVTKHAGVARIGLVPPSDRGLENPRVEVRVSKLRVNGYDFLLFRRPTASITMVGTFHQQPGKIRECEASAEYAEFSSFAFVKELNRALEQAVDSAAHQLVSCMGLTYSDESPDTNL